MTKVEDGFSVGQALDDAVHEAGVAQVFQAFGVVRKVGVESVDG